MVDVKVKVKAGAKEDAIYIKDSDIYIHVKEKPEKGKANKSILKLIKKITGKKAEIVHGIKSNEKIIHIEGDMDEVLYLLRRKKGNEKN